MRTTYLAAAIALALAPTFAPAVTGISMTSGSTGASTTGTGATTSSSSNALTAPATSSSGGGTSTPPASPVKLQNVGTSDSRAASTGAATKANRSSGLSSENTAGTGMSSNTTSGGTGVASGNLTAAEATGQAGEAVGTGVAVGSTTGNDATGGGSTGTGNGSVGNGFVNPVITGALGTTAEGDQVLFDANGNPIGSNGTLGMANTVSATPTVVNNGIAAADVAYADRTMNQVIRQSRAERQRIGRNGQLLYSITPRTGVDRSSEIPDDGPSAFTTPIR